VVGAYQNEEGKTKCKWCQSPNYTAEEGSTECKKCPAGYKCFYNDKETEACDEGTYSEAGSTECYYSPENTYCAGGTKTECPPGSISSNGQSKCNFNYNYNEYNEIYLSAPEIALSNQSKSLLSNFRKYMTSLTNKIEIKDLNSSLKSLLAGDIPTAIGSSIAAGQLSFLALDKIKNNYLDTLEKTFTKIFPNMEKGQLLETLKNTKAFSFAAEVTDKIGYVYGVALPVVSKQIDNFKNNSPWNKHFSDIVSEGTISYVTIEVSAEAGAAIGAAFFGGGAIPGAIAGFTVGVGIQLFTDKAITFDRKTPVDFVRDGFDKLFRVDEQDNNNNNKFFYLE
jgi:hypothetical protein